jgi:hypothetical protein
MRAPGSGVRNPRRNLPGKAMQRFLPLPKGWWVPTPHVLMGPSPPQSRWNAHMCDKQSGEHRREGERGEPIP